MRNPITWWHTRQALNALAEGDYARSRRMWEKLRKRRPDALGIRHNIALTYIGEENYEAAEPLLLAEIEDYGEYYPRLKALADMYYVWGKRPQAHAHYRRALEADDAVAEERGFVERRLELTADDGSFSEVLESLQALRRGNESLDAERWQDAINAFTQAVRHDPTNIQALNNIGTIQLNYQRDPKRAAVTFRRALSWTPLPWLKRNLAQAERAKAQKAEAG